MNTKTEITLGGTAFSPLLFNFDRLVYNRKRRKGISLMHEVLNSSMKRHRYLVFDMGIILGYVKPIRLP
jgi:hypothetical protein